MKQVLTLFLCLIVVSTNAQEQIIKIDSLLNAKLSEHDPGLFVGVVKNGKIIYEGYRGLANLQHQVNVNESTRSNIASTAKQFTALMILELALEEKLSLEDDIRTYLPTFYPKVKDAIRIRHLLNHTSGIRDFYDLMSIQQKPWWRQEGLDNEDAIELLEKQQDLAFQPGSKYVYSNSGYTLLAKIIEVVSGEDFHQHSATFFRNLGMKNTSFLKNYMYVIPNVALPYSDWGNGVWQQYPMITNLYGDGFLFTTLKDQLIFEQAIQNALINKQALLIKSQKPIPNSEIVTYGFGLELEDRLNFNCVHHSGGTGSYHSQTIRFPEEQLTVFVMSNNSKLWSGAIADEIAELFLPEKDVEIRYDERWENKADAISASDLLGLYLSPDNKLVRIEAKDGNVTWRRGNNNPLKLNKETESAYSFFYDPELKVGFYENSLILFYPSGKAVVYGKIPNEEVSLSVLENYEGQYYSEELDVEFTLSLQNDQLMIALDRWDDKKEVEVLSRNVFLFFNYLLKVERDQFDRVRGILLSTNRVLNNKFIKRTNLKFQPKIETENGSINVSTINAKDGKSSQILLTKNRPNGDELWSQQFGGSSYDTASSIIATEDGYLIVGSTASFGKGNYDMYVIKTDKKGKKVWENTYGTFGNEYGYTAEKIDRGFLVRGTIQKHTINTKVWQVAIDENGKELERNALEEVN